MQQVTIILLPILIQKRTQAFHNLHTRVSQWLNILDVAHHSSVTFLFVNLAHIFSGNFLLSTMFHAPTATLKVRTSMLGVPK